jgi:hypothetical protein
MYSHGFEYCTKKITYKNRTVYKISKQYAAKAFCLITYVKGRLYTGIDNSKSMYSSRTKILVFGRHVKGIRAGIFKKSMGARHRGGIGFSYRPAMLHRLEEFIPWNQFWGPMNI